MAAGDASVALGDTLGDEDLCEELRYFAQKTLRRELEEFGLRLQRSMCEELQRFIGGPRASSSSAKSPCRSLLSPLVSKGGMPPGDTIGASPASAADSAVEGQHCEAHAPPEESQAQEIPGCTMDVMDSMLPGSSDSATGLDVLRKVSSAQDGSPSPPGKKATATSLLQRRSWTTSALLTEAFEPEQGSGPLKESTSRRGSMVESVQSMESELNLPGGCLERSGQRQRTSRRRSSPISRIRSRSNSDVEQLPTFIGFKPTSGERSGSLSRSSTVGLEMSPDVSSQRRNSYDSSPDPTMSRRKGSGLGRPCSQSSQFSVEGEHFPSLLSSTTCKSTLAQDTGTPDHEGGGGDFQSLSSGLSSLTSTPESPLERVRGHTFHLVENPKFDWLSCILVSLNAISIGWQTDYMARYSEDHPPAVFRVSDGVFCLIFIFEISLRMFAYGKDFFVGAEWRWNFFDVATVAMQIFEEVTALVAVTTHEHHSTGSNYSYLRLLRLVRLVRVLRIVRVLRFISELRKLVCSIGNSLQSLAWTIVLLIFMLYVVGVCFTQLVSNHIRYTQSMSSSDAVLHEQFGSLGASVLSLFQAMSGGVDWEDLSRPMRDVHWTLEVLFALYIAFAVLAMLNVVTGVFVDSAVQSSTKDQDNDFVLRMHDLYDKTNLNGDGRLTWGAFELQLQKKDVAEYFQNVGINVTEAKSLFELLDVHDSGEIDAEEFVMGCLRLRGPAKSVDLVTLMYDNKRMLRKLHLQFEDVFRVLEANFQISPLARRLSLSQPSSCSSPTHGRRNSVA